MKYVRRKQLPPNKQSKNEKENETRVVCSLALSKMEHFQQTNIEYNVPGKFFGLEIRN